jgi:RimJ/RimL family protein N-acetyltransferase
VELARLIVDPAERGQGLGRRLASGLADMARSTYPLVFLRVHPDNIAAQRCYAAAGFEPVAPHQAAVWNASQPVNYVWLRSDAHLDVRSPLPATEKLRDHGGAIPPVGDEL